PEIGVTRLDSEGVLMREGDAADTVYVLVSGSLVVTKRLNGSQVRLAQIESPGAVVGEMVAMGGGTRTATVLAREPAVLFQIPSVRFHALLDESPDLAASLASAAVRRAEEGELAELLADRLGILDDETLLSACSVVEWRALEPGEVLLEQGDESDAVYFVVRGRLNATVVDPATGQVEPAGESAKNDIVGELGVIANTPRRSTVRAVRHTVVARMPAADFVALVDQRPRLMIEIARATLARAVETRSQTSPTSVIAVAAPISRRQSIVSAIHTELSKQGLVHVLSADRIDAMLGTPGISISALDDIGDVRVARLIHEHEMEADHLILDLGDEPNEWTRRALGLADRILLFTSPTPGRGELDAAALLVADCPSGVRRTMVVEHESHHVPHGSRPLLEKLSCDEALHVARGSSRDLARVARVAAGKGNTLVLGGGGARGFGHVGAYRALIELGFDVDIVGGSSIGGILSSLIGDGHSPGEVVDLARRHFSKLLDYTLPVVSLIKGERIAEAAVETFGDREIEDLRTTFFCVSTDLTAARPHVHRTGSIVIALRATSAIPGVMPPVPLDDALLIDGGVLNNLPMDVGRLLSPGGKVVAIDVAPPRGPGAHGDYGLSVSGWKAFLASKGRNRSQYPRISAVLMRSMITASMRERDRQVVDNLADFYINLDMRGTSLLDFADPDQVVAKGYDAAMPSLEAWLTAEAGDVPTAGILP
ncbi:MAG: cyclic nucleotide-binding domain-containing protein, partial [Acidimicrobiia bacterium]